MAETSPPTSEPGRWTRRKVLALLGGIALAVVLLVIIVQSGGDESAADPTSTAAGGATTAIDSDESGDGSDTTVSGSSDGTAASGSTGGDTSTSTAPAASTTIAESPGSEPATTSTIVVTLPPTTVAGAPPPTTTAGAAPATTSAPVPAPPTTIVVTVPPSLTVPPVTVSDECTVLGIDSFGDVLVELTLTSPTTSVGVVAAGFVLNDAAGDEIVAETIVLDFMAPGEIVRLPTETFEPVPAGSDVSQLSCLIDSVEVGDLLENHVLAGPEDTCSVLGVDDVGDLQISTTVRNPAPEEADLAFTFAVRDPDGARVMSDVGFADELAPGQVSTQEVDTLLPPPPSIDVASLTCDIVGHEVF